MFFQQFADFQGEGSQCGRVQRVSFYQRLFITDWYLIVKVIKYISIHPHLLPELRSGLLSRRGRGKWRDWFIPD
jgi:hypothetical protein